MSAELITGCFSWKNRFVARLRGEGEGAVDTIVASSHSKCCRESVDELRCASAKQVPFRLRRKRCLE